MAETNISWTDRVWNPVVGCSRVSPGCENCYAEAFAYRLEKMGQARYRGLTVLGNDGPRWSREVRQVPEVLAHPLKWRKPLRVFVNSMSDLFHEALPFEYVAAVFGVMAAAPQHTFQVLTKRPARALEFFRRIEEFGGLGRYIRSQRHPSSVAQFFDGIAKVAEYRGRRHRTGDDPWCTVFNVASFNQWPLFNVHLGVTCEDQQRADERIPLLLQCPAAVRWVSAEPLLERIPVIEDYLSPLGTETCSYGEAHETGTCECRGSHLDWVVVGGETGEGRREVDVSAIEDIARLCEEARVPVFVKQDAGKYPGRQGRISDATWALKQFPEAP